MRKLSQGSVSTFLSRTSACVCGAHVYSKFRLQMADKGADSKRKVKNNWNEIACLSLVSANQNLKAYLHFVIFFKVKYVTVGTIIKIGFEQSRHL